MGMFDYVKMPEPVTCPKCGSPVDEFQTKDGKLADAEGVEGFGITLDVSEICDGGCIYGFCPGCGTENGWVEFTVESEKLVPVPSPAHGGGG